MPQFVANSLSDEVEIRLGAEAPEDADPVTPIGLLRRVAEAHPDRPALVAAGEGGKPWTYGEDLADVRAAAAAFVRLGLGAR